MRVIWLDQAEFDLDEHIRYFALHNPIAATEQDLLVHRAVEQLSEYPNSGRPGRLAYTRELVVPRTPFIVLHRVMSDLDEVHILRILHSSQKWPPE
jgi:plasmid stabilization system protein ParE